MKWASVADPEEGPWGPWTPPLGPARPLLGLLTLGFRRISELFLFPKDSFYSLEIVSSCLFDLEKSLQLAAS